ncbi:MAG: SPFH domain-containing protein [Pseudopedobacter sp.]|nr:SPFH domain-containing protein [Deinococcales bacterium]
METRESKIAALPGGLMLLVLLALGAGLAYWMFNGAFEGILTLISSVVLSVLLLVLLGGLVIVQPNTAVVLTLFGRYVGTQRENGWYYINPLTNRKTISLRIRNFNSERQKVNDHDGNPIEIGAVIVWRVVDSARATFDVEHYEQFVSIQTETALRHLASRYPYDAPADELSLRGSADDLAKELENDLSGRLTHAGVEVLEARLSHLAYAPEIAAAMLQRQQAGAIIAARAQIVAGAVGMVQMALEQLERNNIVHLDDERKAQMVSNLLVVLTSERGTQPVVNAGSLY